MKNPLRMTDKEVLRAARKLCTAYKLKRTLRYSTKRDFRIHHESVAEHVFGLFYLAQYFLKFEQIGKSLDKDRLYELLLFHDFGEITHGDVPYHIKNTFHEAREKRDAKKIFASLPEPLSRAGQSRWNEYERRKTPEARFAHAVDKLESMFELLDPVNEKSMKRLKFTYKMHIERKLMATKEFPVMRRFVEVVSNDMLARGIFCPQK